MKKKLVLSAVLLILFVLLIGLVLRVDVATVEATGKPMGLYRLNTAVHETLGTHMLLYRVTKYIGYGSLLLAAAFGCFGVVQLIRRKSLRKVDPALWALAGLYAVTAALYVLFEKVVINYRPILLKGQTEAAASFPSTHTMMFCVILGSAAMLAGRYIKGAWPLWIVRTGCILLLAAGVLWRLVSGVHWFTDILGGMLISGALLLLFSAVLDRIQEKQ